MHQPVLFKEIQERMSQTAYLLFYEGISVSGERAGLNELQEYFMDQAGIKKGEMSGTD